MRLPAPAPKRNRRLTVQTDHALTNEEVLQKIKEHDDEKKRKEDKKKQRKLEQAERAEAKALAAYEKARAALEVERNQPSKEVKKKKMSKAEEERKKKENEDEDYQKISISRQAQPPTVSSASNAREVGFTVNVPFHWGAAMWRNIRLCATFVEPRAVSL